MPDKENFNAVICVDQGAGKSSCNVSEECATTLATTHDGAPAVAYGISPFDSGAMKSDNPTITREVEPNMTAKGPAGVAQPIDTEPHYVVRRLTPTECARLQGFPDWWCDDLGTENPTADDLAFWREVFETHRRITNPNGKPKTDAQIVKWLKNPHADSAEYKMWGNGVALPCVCYVLAGIAGVQ
jgi:DNA (cytosine-5)-methyltransferase 1